ncbi:hypothetical protein KR51_00008940, partial [Rubidibacter lacunae KORDI 51-2]
SISVGRMSPLTNVDRAIAARGTTIEAVCGGPRHAVFEEKILFLACAIASSHSSKFDMKARSGQDFWVWHLWLFASALILVFFVRYLFWAPEGGFSARADATGVARAIVVLFVVAVIVNAINTYSVFFEFDAIKQSRGIFGKHVATLREISANKIAIDQQFSLEIVENKLLRREGWVQLSSNLLITLGMIGTVLGLTIAMGQLSGTIAAIRDNIAASADGSLPDLDAPIAGLSGALAGMSTAFLTTLLGAVLGGLTLKLLSHSTVNLIEDLVDNIRHKTEAEVIPALQREVWEREMLELARAHESVKTFVDGASDVEQSLRNYTQSMATASSQMSAIADDITTKLNDYAEESRQGYLQSKADALLNRFRQLTNAWFGIAVFLGVVLLLQTGAIVVFFASR